MYTEKQEPYRNGTTPHTLIQESEIALLDVFPQNSTSHFCIATSEPSNHKPFPVCPFETSPHNFQNVQDDVNCVSNVAQYYPV